MGEEREFSAVVEEFVSELLNHAGLELDLNVDRGESSVEVRLEGGDSDLVLDNNGQVLEALNDLINQVFFRQGCRIEVDCEDHRLTRIIELEMLARNAAERAKVSGRSVRFQPMPSSERRTIHLTLAEERGVRTESSGSGSRRHVVVWPDASQ